MAELSIQENPYPPFSGDDAICTKCGGAVDKSYQEAGTVFAGQRFVRCGVGPEWLLRECFDCDYRWPEMTADAGH